MVKAKLGAWDNDDYPNLWRAWEVDEGLEEVEEDFYPCMQTWLAVLTLMPLKSSM